MTSSTEKSNIHCVEQGHKLNTGYIYKISSRVTAKYTFGLNFWSTNNYKVRWNQHKNVNDGSPLQNDIRLLGADNVMFVVAESCCMDQYNSITNR
jgi:hypothetical protein